MKLPALALAALFPAVSPLLSGDITYSADVAPILYKHCATCHHPDDIAPMALLTYRQTRPWAAAIREAVLTRQMPPWKADAAHASARVPHYNFNWQITYRMEEPKFIPKGTRLAIVSHFDNSPNNPLNPDPAKVVRWGEASEMEMMDGWIEYVDAPPGGTVRTQVHADLR